MKISYSILWFDDTDEYFESIDLDPLKDTIKSWGFDPKIELVTDPDNFMGHEPFDDFDLIVVDYNLEEYDTHGEEFIRKIRDHDVYTEVIFYSANPASELWDAVRKKELEGVFIASRQNQGVVTKIERVAKQSVRKILDLENMRGLVMAEVGDIDVILDSVVELGIETLDDDKKKQVYDSFYSRAKSQFEGNCTALTEFNSNREVESMLYLCDSYKRWNLLQSIVKRSPKLSNNGFGNYNVDVLKPRNFLAHGKPEFKDGVYSFSHNGETYIYDEEASTSLRKQITDYKSKFLELKELLI